MYEKKKTFERGYHKKKSTIQRVAAVIDSRPYTYILIGKRRPYYEYEIFGLNDDYENKNQKYDLYVNKQIELPRQKLRSGTYNSTEKLFEIKSKSNPDFIQSINHSQLQNLVKDGRISSDTPV